MGVRHSVPIPGVEDAAVSFGVSRLQRMQHSLPTVCFLQSPRLVQCLLGRRGLVPSWMLFGTSVVACL